MSETLRRRPGVLEARMSAEELVLLGPETGTYLGLDAVAADIWDKLAAPMDLKALAAALAEDYDASPERIEKDIAPFIAELLEDGLIERIRADAADRPEDGGA